MGNLRISLLDVIGTTKLVGSIKDNGTYFVQVLYYDELRTVGLDKVQADYFLNIGPVNRSKFFDLFVRDFEAGGILLVHVNGTEKGPGGGHRKELENPTIRGHGEDTPVPVVTGRLRCLWYLSQTEGKNQFASLETREREIGSELK